MIALIISGLSLFITLAMIVTFWEVITGVVAILLGGLVVFMVACLILGFTEFFIEERERYADDKLNSNTERDVK